MTTNVYLIEDHLVLQCVTIDFINKQPELLVIGASQSGKEALAKISEIQPSIIITDPNLFDINGFELITELHRTCPKIPSMVLSSHQELYYVRGAIDAGARGYVVKGYPEQIVLGIQHILDGEIYLCPRSRRKIK